MVPCREEVAAELLQRQLEPGLGPDAGDGGEADGPERLSQGADLQQLVADSQALYAQAYYRHRSYYQAPENIPLVDVAAVEQVRVGELSGVVGLVTDTEPWTPGRAQRRRRPPPPPHHARDPAHPAPHPCPAATPARRTCWA